MHKNYTFIIIELDCKTVRIFAYSSTREQSNKRSGTTWQPRPRGLLAFQYDGGRRQVEVIASFRCYDNSDVIATLIITNFHLYLLNTTVVAIFLNLCL